MARQLTIQERDRIAELLGHGALQTEIAADLGRAPSTISRELARNRTGPAYDAGQAQQAAPRRPADRTPRSPRRQTKPVRNAGKGPRPSHSVSNSLRLIAK